MQFYCLSSCSWYSGVSQSFLTSLSHSKSFRDMPGGETCGLSRGGSQWVCACRSASPLLQGSLLLLLAYPHRLCSSPLFFGCPIPFLFSFPPFYHPCTSFSLPILLPNKQPAPRYFFLISPNFVTCKSWCF